ncbi:uncharacterized protein LOC142972844 isoform X2 [Anticarsia gemmatalis]|uniref:uncharacterized protein LOC142972844 isoform X2 n=1 Tax=Anticarsia gemmatalis TaxID=129554 RepID=UPI003F76E80C
MEVLYDDLENYNDIHALEQLRNENKDLKLKLEEYETAMGKLQKDYDNLALEFHNLQMNYSSLLKTARAEVERKGQMISQLNLDKDMMILKTLQNGGNRRFLTNTKPFQRGPQIPNKPTNLENSKTKVDKKGKNERTSRFSDIKDERCQTNSPSTKVPVLSSDETNLLNIVDKVVEKVEECISKGEHKENISHCNPEHASTTQTAASSVKSRRKSVPAVSLPKFSSEDECEPEKPTKPKVSEENPPSESTETKNINLALMRLSNERLSNRTSESSSIDGRTSHHHESSKEALRSKTSRHYDSDKHRESDRYRQSDKYRETDKYRESDRHKEQDKYREGDKYRDSDKHREGDRYRDSDKYRGREKYDPSHRYRKHHSPDRPYKRPHREYQDNYHRSEHGRHRALESPPLEIHGQYHQRNQDPRSYHDRQNYDDKHRHHLEEKHTGKHTIPTEYEPSSKRKKIEHEVNISEDRRYHDKPVLKLPQTEALEYDMLRTSCQSPDAMIMPDTHAEATPPHTVKEIKDTAATPLEDPRVSSKKYILKSENGKTMLLTAVSKCIDIKPVDKSLWDMESVAMPDALLNKPGQDYDEENIKSIYMDIDNLEPNTTLESGEIYSDDKTDDLRTIHDATDVPRQSTKKDTVLQHEDKNKKAPEATSMPTINLENPQKIPLSYKIPKITQRKQSTENKHVNVTKGSKMENEKYKESKNNESLTKCHTNLPVIEEHDSIIPPIHEIKESEKTHDLKTKEKRISLSDMAMVQDDLELSDETSDNVELHKQMVSQIDHKVPATAGLRLDDTENKSGPKTLHNKGVDNTGIDKPDESDSHKKHKSKRRKTKSKEKDLVENNDIVQGTEKKIKCKKDKESKPKQIKHKFTDLFGDSSSLITPDDLGIPTTCVPLCEDAQDAVDINIKDIVKVPSCTVLEVGHEMNTANDNDDTTYDTNLGTPNTEDKEIAKKIEEQLVGADPDVNIVYQNLNSETETNKPDVVKTVIISSGVQPQFASDDREVINEKRMADVEVNIQNIVESNVPATLADLKKQISLKALATSTPHKDFHLLTMMENDSVDCAGSSNDNRTESVNTSAGHVVDPSDTNTQDSRDAPDVRIFVRRRRKGAKKP